MNITPKQHAVWQFVADAIVETGVSPTFEAVRAAFGWESNAAVTHHLTALTRKGWLLYTEGEYGAIRLPGLAEHVAPHARAFVAGFTPTAPRKAGAK